MLTQTKNNSLTLLFFGLLALILGQHALVYLKVNIQYIDDDQTLMWLGAKDYAKGIFHEPRFYGQAYNTFLEALVAIPFIWMQVPVNYALPLATHLIFLTPFIFTGLYLKKNHQTEKAILIFVLLLCMPLGYDVLTSIPRGFVTGLFFCTFYILSIINPFHKRYIFLNTFLSVVAFLVNPNSLLISLPFLIYIFFHNYQFYNYYRSSIAGIVVALPFEFLLNQFYRSHPENIVFTLDNKFDVTYFIKALSHLDAHFAHVGLLVEGSCIITLLILVLLSVYFFYKNRKWFLSIMIFIAILFSSFFFQKISEGGTWPFFSLSRMFLALPFLYMYSIVLYPSISKKWMCGILVFTACYSVIKIATFNDKVETYTEDKNWLTLSLFPYEKVIQHTSSIKSLCKEYDTDLIIIVGACWGDNFINYGGPALFDDYPRTFKPHFERRRWRTNEEMNKVNESFIIYSRDPYLDMHCQEKDKSINIQKINEQGMFYVYNNQMITLQFLKRIGAETLGF